MYKTQAELERYAYQQGRERTAGRITSNEEKGRAGNNPYAQALYRRFVLPLAEKVRQDLDAKGPAKLQAHVKLLAGVDEEATAFLAVRTAMTHLLTSREKATKDARGLMLALGNAAYHERILTLFADASPDLFYMLCQDFDRRHTGENHRLTVFKLQAKQAGIEWTPWPVGAKEQVGAYLLDGMVQLGMVEAQKTNFREFGRPRTAIVAYLDPGVMDIVTHISDFVGETTPYFLPCIERPRPWTALNEGGWHTPELRRIMPFCVKVKPADIEHYEAADLSKSMAAINLMQNTAWKINTRVLDAVKEIARHYDMDEIISQADLPKPKMLPWLVEGMTKDDMNPDELVEFRDWKRSISEWHYERKTRGTKAGRFYVASRVAEQFRDYPELFFVYQSDFRDRKYAQTTGVSPQGSDLQKSLLHFAKGLPLEDAEAVEWFTLLGTAKWGYDKEPVVDRVQWVHERDQMIRDIADDPISNRSWQEADDPLQFLAWCFEWTDWKRDPDSFVSHLPVGQDGSCSGLQHFSALFRDEVGGRATNLVPAARPQDIYGLVAAATSTLLETPDEDEDKEAYRLKWVKHGINRTLVKRSTMTLPYSSTRFSCSDFILEDYLKKGKAPEFAKEDYRRAATYLSFPVWDAIGQVVIKGVAGMGWLQQVSGAIIKDGHEAICWTAPSGFPVRQTYWKRSEHRINTKLLGATKILVKADKRIPAPKRHRNGIVPNFIHSLDAAHLTLTVAAAGEQGIEDFAMIHDDFGCHAAHAGKLSRILREEFIKMYRDTDPLGEFAERYPDAKIPPRPEAGALDLDVIRDSTYFFI